MSPDPQWPEGNDPDMRQLARALDDARLRGPDDMTLRRGWTTLAGLVTPTAPARGRRWSYFAGGIATTATLGLAAAALLWPRTIERPSTIKAPVAQATEVGMRRLTLDGGVEAKLSTASVMRLDGVAPRVEGGEVRFSVPKRAPGNPFVVRVARYRVVVLGTRFGVALDGSHNVAVDVEDGTVEVFGEGADGRLAHLHRGESWRSPLADDATHAANDGAASAPSAIAAAPPSPSEASAAAERPAEPMQASHHAVHVASRTVAMAAPDGAAASTGTVEAAAAGDPTSAARAALAAGDGGKALQLYRTLAQRSGPAAENAAYEIGKILDEKLGQPASAVAAWRRYRSDHPSGILRLEADVSIIEVLARSGETDEALAEATDFLRRHPESERRAEIARVAGDLYRGRGDCRRAVGAYQVALGAARTPDVADPASFHRAACLVRLGDAGGPDAVRAYLRANPSGRFRAEAAALLGEDRH